MGKFTEMVQSKEGARVFLVRGDEGGRAAWYFVLVDKLKVPIFTQMMKDGDYNLNSVGTVFYSGWGDNPPDDIRAAVQSQYGN